MLGVLHDTCMGWPHIVGPALSLHSLGKRTWTNPWTGHHKVDPPLRGCQAGAWNQITMLAVGACHWGCSHEPATARTFSATPSELPLYMSNSAVFHLATSRTSFAVRHRCAVDAGATPRPPARRRPRH